MTLCFLVKPKMIQAELRETMFCNILKQCENKIQEESSVYWINLEVTYFNENNDFNLK